SMTFSIVVKVAERSSIAAEISGCMALESTAREHFNSQSPDKATTIASMTESAQPTFEEMIAAITKTFIVANVDASDEYLALSLVNISGRLACRMHEQGVSTKQKTSVSDVVTEADRAAEKFGAGVLEAIRAEDGIVGEEGAQRKSQSGRTWVIDPVDGTYNFT